MHVFQSRFYISLKQANKTKTPTLIHSHSPEEISAKKAEPSVQISLIAMTYRNSQPEHFDPSCFLKRQNTNFQLQSTQDSMSHFSPETSPRKTRSRQESPTFIKSTFLQQKAKIPSSSKQSMQTKAAKISSFSHWYKSLTTPKIYKNSMTFAVI